MSKTRQRSAKLRVCASCEWIYKINNIEDDRGCPKCGFATYGARFVYGDKAYRYAKTQKPWLDRKLSDYETKLRQEIRENDIYDPRSDNYVGHNIAIQHKKAKCLCIDVEHQRDIDCPFHGR